MILTSEEKIRQCKLLINFDPFIEIAIQAQKLPLQHQVAFFASACERLLPIYLLVSDKPGWGNISILTSIKDKIWESTFGIMLSGEEVKDLLSRLDNIIVGGDNDDEDYTICDESPLTEEAREIVRYFDFLLRYIINSELKIFIDVFIIPIYIIYGRVDYLMDGDLQVNFQNEKITKHRKCALEHQLMKLELNKQSSDLNFLQSNPDLNATILSVFRNNACINERSLLGTIEEIQAMCEE